MTREAFEIQVASYPIYLTTHHISEILGIGVKSAREMFHSRGFPVAPKRAGFKKELHVAKDDFVDWWTKR